MEWKLKKREKNKLVGNIYLYTQLRAAKSIFEKLIRTNRKNIYREFAENFYTHSNFNVISKEM